MGNINCILVGTQLDLKEEYQQSGDPEKLKKVVTTEEMEEAAKANNFWASVECSAKQNRNIDELFNTALDSML